MEGFLAQSPSKSASLRPSSLRPQTHRYLQESVLKFGDDSARAPGAIGNMLVPAATLSPLRQRPTDLPGPLYAKPGDTELLGLASGADMWRRAFNAEAMQCVQAMKAVVEKADPATFSARFDEWRKTDLKVTAQVQQHVKELGRLNGSLDDFLNDCKSIDTLAGFKSSFLRLNDCVDELSATNQGLSSNVNNIAQRAANKVCSAWRAEVQLAQEQQQQQWTTDSARWTKLDDRMDVLQQGLQELRDTVGAHSQRIDCLEAAQDRASTQISSALGQTVNDLRQLADQQLVRLEDASRATANSNLEAFKQHVSVVLSGAGGIAGSLGTLDQRMSEWERATNTELAKQRDAARDLEENMTKLEEIAETARSHQASTEEALKETTATLTNRISGLQHKVDSSEDALRRAQEVSLEKCMKRLKELDARGNVKVNRQTGDVQVSPIAFVAAKPGEAEANFVDPSVADRVLLDVAELFSIFDGPVRVEAHMKPGKGGKPDFWNQVANNQADLIRQRLEASGAPAERVEAVGLAGKKGLNLDAIVVKLNKDLFPEEMSAAPPKKGGKK